MLYNEPKHYEQIPGYLSWFMSHKLVITDSDQLTRDEFCAMPVYNEDMTLSALVLDARRMGLGVGLRKPV